MAKVGKIQAGYVGDKVVVTELRNSLSTNIDVATPAGIVEVLDQCDREIFQGWNNSKGLLDGRILEKATEVIHQASQILQNPEKKLIVLSGCGTSGRIAFMIARNFNAKLRARGISPCFDYLMAGGDETLFKSEELSEDDPHTGHHALQECCRGKQRVLYIGITCGMSAPYVAGQLDFCMDNLDVFTPVLLGFNAVSAARNLNIEGWDKTFHMVADRLDQLQDLNKGFILNPIIGPEPITGSSRMKGGSATKILLEAILTDAYLQALQSVNSDLSSLILAYDVLRHEVYKQKDCIGEAIKLAGNSLQTGGHITYLASHNNLGIVGLVDASECKPTYGSAPDEVQAFVDGGYQYLDNKAGHISNMMEISTDYFNISCLNRLNKEDIVVLLTQDGIICSSFKEVLHRPAKTVAVNFKTSPENYIPEDIKNLINGIIEVDFPKKDMERTVAPSVVRLCEQQYLELGTKWVCNALTTGAHILKGMIFENIMINVGLNNHKLFHRAVSIIVNCTGVSPEKARVLLLQTVYQQENVQDVLDLPISSHIKSATEVKLVVPSALLMAQSGCSLKEAHKMLQETPGIREALEKLKQ